MTDESEVDANEVPSSGFLLSAVALCWLSSVAVSAAAAADAAWESIACLVSMAVDLLYEMSRGQRGRGVRVVLP